MKEAVGVPVETFVEIEPYGYVSKYGGKLVSTIKSGADDVAVFTQEQVHEIVTKTMDQVLDKIGLHAREWTHEFVDENVQ